MLIWILIIVLAIPITAVIIGWAISAPRYQGAISDHFNGKQFFPKKPSLFITAHFRLPMMDNKSPLTNSKRH